MKENKKIVRLLGIVLLGLWGVIGYQVVEAISGGGADEGKPEVLAEGGQALTEIEPYTYKADVRDPFTFQRRASHDSLRTKQTVKPIVQEPAPFTLNGILRDRREKTAILERKDGFTFFVREGDTLSGVKIIMIEEQSVSYRYRKQKMSWHLER